MTNEFDDTFNYYDEYPQDDPFIEAPVDDLKHKDEIVEDLINAIDDYLAFETPRNLMKLIAERL